jgi:hypothetical protein
VTALHGVRLGLLLGVLTLTERAHSEPSETGPARSEKKVECPPSSSRTALAASAALVPGIIVHGAGHWVLCERTTAQRLALIEAAGVGATLVSGAGLFATGASRYFVTPLALGVLGGVSLFGVTLFADLYGVLAPPGGLGRPAAPRLLSIETGARWIYDPQFSYRAFLSHGFRVDTRPIWLAPRMDVALDAKNRRYSLTTGYRLLGSARKLVPLSGSWLDAKLGFTDHAYGDDGFSMTILEASLAARLELSAIGKTLRGSFADTELGYARQWSRFQGFPDDALDELLFRTAFGVYLGRGQPFEGEARIAYDHRRDTFAGGLRMAGIGAGYLGFLEQRTEFYLGALGGALELSYGSALIVSASFLVRVGK